ncbi:MAG: GAF domain-containing sensor histidine kinase [Gemmatimonadales bacterium]
MNELLNPATTSELAAPLLQAAVNIALALVTLHLYRRHRKRYFLLWSVAWLLYTLRIGVIVTFLGTTNWFWLYAHQVITGWTAFAFLYASLAFAADARWRPWFWVLVAFPPVWSYVAIYQLDHFIWAAGPAVLFLSMATGWTGWVFWRHHRLAQSVAAGLVAVTMGLWALHHLDYPFLRARGAWNPWGYYLDIVFALTVGFGFLLLVLEDLRGGLMTLSALSGDLHHRSSVSDAESGILERPLSITGVRGTAMFATTRGASESLKLVTGRGVCSTWEGETIHAEVEAAVRRSFEQGQPTVVHDVAVSGASHHGYVAALPIVRGVEVAGVLMVVGDARDPFAALDDSFLDALGKQVGAAIDNSELYRELEERKTELEQLAAQMLQQHEEERRRLARELHDETAQVFSAVKMQLGVMREAAEGKLAEELARTVEMVDQGIGSIRNVTNDLRPTLLDDLGLEAALRALVDEFSSRSDVQLSMRVESISEVSQDAELALFRSLQEGLSNLSQHARARVARVAVRAEDGWLIVALEDDGVGPPSELQLEDRRRNGHMGIAGMKERLSQLDGRVSLESSELGGARLDVRVPVKQ